MQREDHARHDSFSAVPAQGPGSRPEAAFTEAAPTEAAGGTPAWHSLEALAVLELLQADGSHGLTAAEAARRLRRFGPNRLPQPPRRPAWKRFLAQLHNVLIYVMLTAAVIMALLGHGVDTAVLLAAVLVNAVVGFVQEGKAERAL